jgi:hypothetical protein
MPAGIIEASRQVLELFPADGTDVQAGLFRVGQQRLVLQRSRKRLAQGCDAIGGNTRGDDIHTPEEVLAVDHLQDPPFFIGLRERYGDLRERLADRIQLTSDGWSAYLNAVDKVFGDDIDYAQLQKIYGPDYSSEKRYCPPKCIGAKRAVIKGNPDDGISARHTWNGRTSPYGCTCVG